MAKSILLWNLVNRPTELSSANKFSSVLTFAEMYRFLQHTLLFMAWAILFAHSIVPHMHESDEKLEEVCASNHEHEGNLLEAEFRKGKV